MFSKFITNYIEQRWWHSSLSLKCMHLQLKEVKKRGRHAYILHGWTCLASGIVMEIHCHITGICEAAMSSSLFSVICSWFSKVLLFLFITKINSPNLNAPWLIYVPPKVNLKNHLECHFKVTTKCYSYAHTHTHTHTHRKRHMHI